MIVGYYDEYGDYSFDFPSQAKYIIEYKGIKGIKGMNSIKNNHHIHPNWVYDSEILSWTYMNYVAGCDKKKPKIGELKMSKGMLYGYIETPEGPAWVEISRNLDQLTVWNQFRNELGRVFNFKLSELFIDGKTGLIYKQVTKEEEEEIKPKPGDLKYENGILFGYYKSILSGEESWQAIGRDLNSIKVLTYWDVVLGVVSDFKLSELKLAQISGHILHR